MKKIYKSPCTVLYRVETTILCASSGIISTQANGLLQSISKGSGQW